MSGTDYVVTTQAELNQAIEAIDSQTAPGNDVITFNGNITESAPTAGQPDGIYALDLASGVSVTIDGNGYTLNGSELTGSGDGADGGLAVIAGKVTISDLTIEDTIAQGGDGEQSGGGGAGLGGGLFVGSNASVVINNVSFKTDSAIGGNGGSGGGGGGGGKSSLRVPNLGGNGTAGTKGTFGAPGTNGGPPGDGGTGGPGQPGGPGGFGGDGGEGGDGGTGGKGGVANGNGNGGTASRGGAGGLGGTGGDGGRGGLGGNGGDGGDGGDGGAGGPGGGNFAVTPAGYTRVTSAAGGGDGGDGGDGGNGAAGSFAGGGGAGGNGGDGGQGGISTIDSPRAKTVSGTGGDGGDGGHGGQGGSGGFGGGGGGGGNGGAAGDGGSARYGGNAGNSGAPGSGGDGGSGGFGGGGGGAGLGGKTAGTAAQIAGAGGQSAYGGYGAGNGGASSKGGGGGGGLGAGGDIFVQQGGSLTVDGGLLTQGYIAGGGGSGGGGQGYWYGAGLFLQGDETVTLEAPAGQALTVSGTISDQRGWSGASDYGTLDIAGSGTVKLAATNNFGGGIKLQSGTLDLAVPGAAGTGAITFDPGGGDPTLEFAAADAPNNPIDNFGPNDVIQIDDFRETSAPGYTNNILTLHGTDETGSTPETVTLDIPGQALADFQINVGSTNTTIDYVTCYCRGTLICTGHGEVPVETLAIGDLVRTASGALRSIKWIGRRSYAGRLALGQKQILPVGVKAGALDDRVPKRDLWVSPNHAMYFSYEHGNGVLIEARDLVNGVSIVQAERVDKVEYFHIELDDHDLIIAEGALSETFIDDNSRGVFHNAHEYRVLYPREEAAAPARYCAPRLQDGYEVEAVRERIAFRVGLPSSKVSRAASLRGYVDRVSARSITGWAQNVEHPEAPVCLDIYGGGQLIGRTLANRYREDLERAGVGSGNHSFAFSLPTRTDFDVGTVSVRRSLDGVTLLPSAQKRPRRLANSA